MFIQSAGKIGLNAHAKIVVTSASGLQGSKIVNFDDRDYTIIPPHNAKPLHPHSLKLDITNNSEVVRLFHKLKPHAVSAR